MAQKSAIFARAVIFYKYILFYFYVGAFKIAP